MKYVLVNYNFDPSWVKEYTDDYLIYDRSDDGNDWTKDLDPGKVIKTDNLGQVDYDKLCYLADNYHDLPDYFVWGKTNLFKFISKEEFDKVKENKFFTPLLTQSHLTYNDKFGTVCYYSNGMYFERNDSWYLSQFPTRSFHSFDQFAQEVGIPTGHFIPFPPGGNFILTKEAVHKYSRDLYANMADSLPYTRLPGEAQIYERAYYLLWRG